MPCQEDSEERSLTNIRPKRSTQHKALLPRRARRGQTPSSYPVTTCWTRTTLSCSEHTS